MKNLTYRLSISYNIAYDSQNNRWFERNAAKNKINFYIALKVALKEKSGYKKPKDNFYKLQILIFTDKNNFF